MKRLYALLIFICIAFSQAVFAGPVNVNTADAAALSANLKGVGPAKAEAIIAYRTANGPFQKPEDLLKVKGIGQKTLDANRDAIRLK